MPKSFVIKGTVNDAGQVVKKLPPALKGMDEGLLAAVYDAAVKYGINVVGVKVRRLEIAGPDGRAVFISANLPDCRSRNMIVGRQDGFINRNNVEGLIFGEDDSGLVWDRSVSVEEVRAALAARDELMAEVGAYDPATGRRRRIEADTERPAVLPVDTVFAQRMATVVIDNVDGRDEEAILASFDRPNEVELVTVIDSRAVIMRKSDVAAGRAAATEAMEKLGIKEGEFETLTPERRRAFDAAYHAVLARLLGPKD